MSCLALALAGCQGGGSSPAPFNSGVAPPPSVTSSGSVTPSGGAVMTTVWVPRVTLTAPPDGVTDPLDVTEGGGATPELNGAGLEPPPWQPARAKARQDMNAARR